VNNTKGKTTTILTSLHTDEPPPSSRGPVTACHEVGATRPLAPGLAIGQTIEGEGEGVPNTHNDLAAAVLRATVEFLELLHG
jgi:hypothetical protein